MIRVLVVEDEAKIRKGICNHIEWNTLGIDEVKDAESPAQALEICRHYEPDIVLSDIRMPGMTGVEMCREIRKLYPECKVIFITGFAEKEYLMAAIELHVIRYVEKPVRIPDVTEALEEAVLEVRKQQNRQSNALIQMLFSEKTLDEAQSSDPNHYWVLVLRGKKELSETIMNALNDSFHQVLSGRNIDSVNQKIGDRESVWIFLRNPLCQTISG